MLAAVNVTKRFNPGGVNEVTALRKVSLRLDEGEFVTVIGSNGAGKSTLLNTLAGVYPPDEGRVELDGRDVSRLEEHRRAAWIGRVFQNPLDGTAGSLRVEENLALALRRGGRRGLATGVTEGRRRAFRNELTQLHLGLEDRLHQAVGLLSGGQRQALALVMATLVKPRLLLLDEHTAALDPAAAQEVEALTVRLVGEHGLTALMVTHNMQQALRVGTRTLMLHAGEIVFDIAGAERRTMTVQGLVERFHAVRHQALVDDELLLTGS
jgi:putative tryptophan/tyrosine transport system ATP-binding protein